MQWWVWLCFIIMIAYSGYPGRVRKLENQVKKLKRQLKGEESMSKILNSLINQECMIKTEELWGSNDGVYTILEADDEWVKISYTTKKGELKLKIIRIESIDTIQLIQKSESL